MQKTHSRLDHLVSVRGLAAWLVVFFHSMALLRLAIPQLPRPIFSFISHGYLAVDFFFVLSGFIIFINYHAKFFSGFRHNALSFYWNRISRIYPVHVFMLAAYLFLAVMFLYLSSSRSLPPGYTAESFWESIGLIQAWTGNSASWNVPSWSISAEWFVYLLFPFIAILFRKFLGGLTAHLLLAVSLLIAVYAVYSLLGIGSLGTGISSMALVRAFFEFLLGTITGSLFIHHREFLTKCHAFTGVMAVVVFSAFFYTDIPNYAAIPLLCFLLVSFLCVDVSVVSKILSNKLLVYLGEISYSTYMAHYFVYDVFKAGWIRDAHAVNPVQLLTSFLAVLLLSMLMHKALEIPAQQYLRIGLFKHFGARIGFRD